MLSVVITTWNEAHNLPRVVKSVKNIADEIIVVDTQSTDATVTVAKKLGCKVYTHKNTGIVEPVRNFSISKATGDWILLLDADEELPESLCREISLVITSNTAEYFRIPRKNIIFQKHITSSHWWPDYVYRLFKKGFVVWSDAIHSIPVTRGRGFDFPPNPENAIIHHHYQSISQYLQRIDRYTDHQLQLLIKQSTKFSWYQLVTFPCQEFIRQLFSRQGYKDGVHGLVLASLQAFSELVLYLKLWQHSKFSPQDISLKQLDQQLVIQFKQYRWWQGQYMVNSANFLLRPFVKLFNKIKSIFI